MEKVHTGGILIYHETVYLRRSVEWVFLVVFILKLLIEAEDCNCCG